jgi:hypothetical protein
VAIPATAARADKTFRIGSSLNHLAVSGQLPSLFPGWYQSHGGSGRPDTEEVSYSIDIDIAIPASRLPTSRCDYDFLELIINN